MHRPIPTCLGMEKFYESEPDDLGKERIAQAFLVRRSGTIIRYPPRCRVAMNIAINASLLDGVPTGLGVYTEHLLLELTRLLVPHHDVRIFTSAARRDAFSGCPVVPIPQLFQPRFGVKAAAARFVWTQTVLPWHTRECDVLYSTTHHGALWHPRRQIITIHDLLPVHFPAQYRLQHLYFTTVLPRLLKAATAVIADSEHTRADVHRVYGTPLEKIWVVHCGADHLSHRPTIGVDVKDAYGLGRYILAVGASYPHKNLIRGIDAFAIAKRSIPDLQCAVIAGPSEYLNAVKRHVAEGGLSDVKFLGYVDQRDMPQLYASAAAFIYPSLYEGFGLPPLEAMVHGCPAIVSRASSLPEVCGEAAYYIDPLAVDDMAKAMTTVVQSQSLQDDLRVKGARRAALFTWERAAKRLYALFQELASAAPASHRAVLA